MIIWRLFPLAIVLFALLRFVVPLKIGRWWKVAMGTFVLAMPLQRLLISFLYRGLAPGETPAWAILLQGILLSAVVFLAVFVILRDLALIVTWICRKKIAWLNASSARLALGLFGAALLLSCYGAWQAARVPSVRHAEIAIPNLPPEMDGLAIVQLTDLHATKLFDEKWMRAVVEKANSLNPDLVLLTGDIVDGSPRVRRGDVAPLAELRAKLGAFGAPGNHDNFSGQSDWLGIFKEMGIAILINEHVEFTLGGSKLVLAGLADRSYLWRGGPPPDLVVALDMVPKGVPIILMAHQPARAKENAKAGVALQLSGHTHGGQIIGLKMIVKAANDGYVSGLYDVDGMKLYVCNGAGLWTGLPVRLGVPSEIAHIVLRSPKVAE
ncbi:MAG: metallophosphoesterase [Holophagales bacterium]|jgi:predicted MPP superfamily phosphohydrolase|nr:metallophosphoesterase [Holophagales bacterium]